VNYIFIGLLGLAFGSFINAYVWRVHTKRPIAKARSICPECKHQLNALELVPVVSWLMLRGKCRYCGKPISLQYPLVELLTAGLFVLSYLGLPKTGVINYVLLGFWLAQLVSLIALAIYDFKWMLLPNKMLLPAALIAILQIITHSYLDQAWAPILNSPAAAAAAGGFFYLLFGVSGGKWMGGGDVKLALVLGLILGLKNTLIGLLIGFNIAAIVSVVLIASKKMSRKDLIPFGPFLILGAIIAMLWGNWLWETYQQIFVLS